MCRRASGRWMAVLLCWMCALSAAENTVTAVPKPGLVVVDREGLPVTVRLANLMIPEAIAPTSLTELEKLLKGRDVRVTFSPEAGMDAAGLPQVYLFAGSLNVNQVMLKRGLAKYEPGANPSKSYHQLMNLAQNAAQSDQVGLWTQTAAPTAPGKPAEKPVEVAQAKVNPGGGMAKPEPKNDIAPAGYNGPVVADLNSKEYHLPGSRFAQSIRSGAKIEYKNPAEAERAGKAPSPFSFPERAKELAAKASTELGSNNPNQVVAESRKALEEALKYIQEAREQSRTDNKSASANFKKAGKILSTHLDKLVPVADSHPNDQAIQSLAEEMSMNLYSCNKYQTL